MFLAAVAVAGSEVSDHRPDSRKQHSTLLVSKRLGRCEARGVSRRARHDLGLYGIGVGFRGFLSRLVGRAGRVGGAAGRGHFAFEPGDQVLETCGLTGEIRGMLPFLAQRSLGRDLGGLPSFDQGRKARPFGAKSHDLLRQRVALLCHRAAQSRQLRKIGRQSLGGAPQLRHHSPEQHRRPDREEHVVRADQDRGEGLSAHALQSGQHLSDDGASRHQRLFDRLLAAGQEVEALFDCRHLGLGRTNAVGRVDQSGAESDPIRPDRFEIGFGLLALSFGFGRIRVEIVELLLFVVELAIMPAGFGRRDGLPGSRHDGKQQERRDQKARPPTKAAALIVRQGALSQRSVAIRMERANLDR